MEKTEKINQFLPQSSFIPTIVLSQLEEFPILREEFDNISLPYHCPDITICPEVISIEGDNLESFLINGKNQGLTHLVVDNDNNLLKRESFFKDVFSNEMKYPYLVKVFDSKEYKPDFRYQLKIFEIDYELFDSIVNKKE